jgi:hypothetical protein
MKRLLFVVVLLSICAGIRADEGMWTFDNVPRAEIKAIAGLPAAEVAAARNKVVTTLDSIAGSYWFDAEMNRSVAVHPQFIRTALAQVYRARAVAQELGLEITP